MDDFINISSLNDYVFCPYSIYLHNVYMETDESIYHATPQIKGRIAHEAIDLKHYSTRKDELTSLCVFSEKLEIGGKIDLYKRQEKTLIERKYVLKKIYRGQLYQLWAEYFCMIEMGYEIKQLAFYEISTNRTTQIPLPGLAELNELTTFLKEFRNFDVSRPFEVNPEKCRHCIYCNLCDKNESDHVYNERH